VIIRQEKPSEFQSIYDLVKVAFQTAKVADGNEQDYVDKLHASSNYIPELALVAEEDGKIIGHIMLTKTYVATGNSKFEALLVAPLFVALEYRKRGIASKLVKESFDLAKNLV
jgi:predicted N-acetyltransferase YhbS